jgi:hypothetical protein
MRKRGFGSEIRCGWDTWASFLKGHHTGVVDLGLADSEDLVGHCDLRYIYIVCTM